MNTSYYTKYKGENAISIAGKCPDLYKGREYKKLAPKYWFWKKWHDGEFSNDDYIKYYNLEVLDKLDAQTVYNELGENSVLLCHEPSEIQQNGEMKFCHRHLVADWFKRELGIVVIELD